MKRSSRFSWMLGLLLVGGLATAVRVARVGQASLDFDEYLHVFAAKHLSANGHPTLPSGHDYGRALPYTWMVSQSMRWFGTSEAAVRLPSVLFGVGLVWLAGWIAKRWWGVGASSIVMVLVALEPYSLQMSTVCRMYAPFHFLYLGVLFAVYEALEGERTSRQRAAWWLAAGLGTIVSMTLHPLTGELFISLLGYVAIRGVLTRQRKYWGLLAAAVILGLSAAAIGVVNVPRLWHEANWAPAYAAPFRYDYGFYLRRLWAEDPWVVVLIVPALAWWLWRDRTRGWYMLCAIGIPYGLHAFIFDWKEDRYILHLMAPTLLVIGSACWYWARWVAQRAARLTRDPEAASRWMAPVAAAILLVALAGECLAGRSLNGLDGEVANWRGAYALLRPRIRPDDQLIISVPLVSAYYLGRLPNYIVLNALVSDSGHESVRGADGLYRDWYTGQPLVTDAAELKTVFRKHRRGWIVMDAARFPYETCVPRDVRELIKKRAHRLPMPDESVIVYSWGV